MIPHHQAPTGKNECARRYRQIDREGDAGAVPPRSYAYDRRRFGRIRVLTMANSKTVTKYRFLQSLFCGGSALLGWLINYRTRNRSAYGVGAIGVSYQSNLRIFLDFGNRHISEISPADTACVMNVITSFRQVAGVVNVWSKPS
jgi:hypothetical protein